MKKNRKAINVTAGILAAALSMGMPMGTMGVLAENGVVKNAETVLTNSFTGQFEKRPDNADLSKQGSLDWVRFDSVQFGNFNRKDTLDPQILDLKLIGASGDLTGNAETNFTYADGTSPVDAPDTCKDALIFTGTGNGISFKVPGGQMKKCLDIYTGAWAAQLLVTVKVNGEEAYRTTFEATDTTSGSPAEYQTLRLDYSTPSKDDEVEVTVVVNQVYDAAWGNMNIGAITLGTRRINEDASTIGGTIKTAPAAADLTGEGKLDWVYLNDANLNNVNKKNIVSHEITNLALTDALKGMTMSEKTKTGFVYSDGTNPAEESDVHKAAVFTGKGAGLSFEVPGSEEERYVNIYTGAWAADAKIEVLVNGKVQYTAEYGSANTTPDTTDYRVVRLKYQTEREEDTVQIRVVTDEVYDASWGNINISAITLSDEKPVNLDETIHTDSWEIDHTGGQVCTLKTKIAGEMYEIPMRQDQYSGFTWKWNGKKILMTAADKNESGRMTYQGTYKDNGQDLTFTMSYDVNDKDQMVVSASVKNNQNEEVDVDTASISLGFDTYMASYPEYNDQLFPTMMRCEKTHAWGYFSTPSGRLLTFATDSPVASYTMNYESGAHRIYSASLDVLKSGELPARHPQDMNKLEANEEKTWNIYFKPVDTLHGLNEVKSTIADNTQIPVFDADRYTVGEGESTKISVYSDKPVEEVKVDKLENGNAPNVRSKDGETDTKTTAYIPQATLTDPQVNGNCYTFIFDPKEGAGVYRLTVNNGAYESEAMITERNTWKWYMQNAKEAAVDHPAKAADCCESWYGLYSAYLGQKYFPNEEQDAKIDANFADVYSVIGYDENGVPKNNASRIQNHSTTVGILTDKYEAQGNIEDLEKAVKIADWLIDNKQDENGAYIGPTGDYTSVIYPAKSIMELMYAEKELARSDREDQDVWQARYDRHYDSVKRAMDNLVRLGGDLHTEGQITLEDGAVACSATQLSEFALMHPEGSKDRQKYQDGAKLYLDLHESLEQRLIPDSRMNGGSLRFWEAQYDTLVTANPNNMMNSPHGWTAWSIYAQFNMYELTGDQEYLERGMNALGSCVQLMGFDGNLYWAFIADPQIKATLSVQKPGDTSEYGEKVGRQVTLGETYVDMITDWWKTPQGMNVGGYYGQGGSCDNDVHEIFKAMEELVLTKAYVTENGDGTYETYNCTAEEKDGKLLVKADEEELTDEIIFNMASDKKTVNVQYSDKTSVETSVESGISHVKKSDIPSEETLSTAVLEYAISLTENVRTEGVIASVVKTYETALANAKDVLARAQASESGLTQQIIDDAWKELIKAMQYLSFKQGDKADLEKVIALAETMEKNITSYMDEGKETFLQALQEARDTKDNTDAMQEEVDSAWKNLLQAMADLRLKPNKQALEELVSKASTLRRVDYEAESFTKMRTALTEAQEVLADEEADQKEVDTCAAALEDAVAKLERKEPVKDTEKETKKADTVADKKLTADASANTNTEDGPKPGAQKSVKTGDDNPVMPAAGLLASAMAAIAVFGRKKK